MFKKNDGESPDRISGSAVTTVVSGTTFTGNIESEQDLRIDGKVIGNILCKSKVVIGPSGIVDGSIDSVHADVMGSVRGEISAHESLQLRGKARLEGNLYTKSLSMEHGVLFNGQCQMGSPVSQIVELETGSKNKSKSLPLANAN